MAGFHEERVEDVEFQTQVTVTVTRVQGDDRRIVEEVSSTTTAEARPDLSTMRSRIFKQED